MFPPVVGPPAGTDTGLLSVLKHFCFSQNVMSECTRQFLLSLTSPAWHGKSPQVISTSVDPVKEVSPDHRGRMLGASTVGPLPVQLFQLPV